MVNLFAPGVYSYVVDGEPYIEHYRPEHEDDAPSLRWYEVPIRREGPGRRVPAPAETPQPPRVNYGADNPDVNHGGDPMWPRNLSHDEYVTAIHRVVGNISPAPRRERNEQGWSVHTLDEMDGYDIMYKDRSDGFEPEFNDFNIRWSRICFVLGGGFGQLMPTPNFVIVADRARIHPPGSQMLDHVIDTHMEDKTTFNRLAAIVSMNVEVNLENFLLERVLAADLEPNVRAVERRDTYKYVPPRVSNHMVRMQLPVDSLPKELADEVDGVMSNMVWDHVYYDAENNVVYLTQPSRARIHRDVSHAQAQMVSIRVHVKEDGRGWLFVSVLQRDEQSEAAGVIKRKRLDFADGYARGVKCQRVTVRAHRAGILPGTAEHDRQMKRAWLPLVCPPSLFPDDFLPVDDDDNDDDNNDPWARTVSTPRNPRLQPGYDDGEPGPEPDEATDGYPRREMRPIIGRGPAPRSTASSESDMDRDYVPSSTPESDSSSPWSAMSSESDMDLDYVPSPTPESVASSPVGSLGPGAGRDAPAVAAEAASRAAREKQWRAARAAIRPLLHVDHSRTKSVRKRLEKDQSLAARQKRAAAAKAEILAAFPGSAWKGTVPPLTARTDGGYGFFPTLAFDVDIDDIVCSWQPGDEPLPPTHPSVQARYSVFDHRVEAMLRVHELAGVFMDWSAGEHTYRDMTVEEFAWIERLATEDGWLCTQCFAFAMLDPYFDEFVIDLLDMGGDVTWLVPTGRHAKRIRSLSPPPPSPPVTASPRSPPQDPQEPLEPEQLDDQYQGRGAMPAAPVPALQVGSAAASNATRVRQATDQHSATPPGSPRAGAAAGPPVPREPDQGEHEAITSALRVALSREIAARHNGQASTFDWQELRGKIAAHSADPDSDVLVLREMTSLRADTVTDVDMDKQEMDAVREAAAAVSPEEVVSVAARVAAAKHVIQLAQQVLTG